MTEGTRDHEANDSNGPAEQGAHGRPDPHGEVLDHAYDGIQEYDNPMPRWWVNVFWATFIFSIGYFIHYQLSGQGPNTQELYAQELREAREQEARLALGSSVSEPGLQQLMSNAGMMQDAKLVFEQRCAPCHGQQGEGMIGPNLTDGSWLHGSKLMDIYGVVQNGVSAKGMPAWGRQLTPVELSKVSAYVGTLRGRNVPGKAPEGTPVAAAAVN